MPQPIGEDELKLKQRARRRLIGATALLAALVLVLPMVLDKKPKQESDEISVHIPTANQVPVNPDLATTPPEPKPVPVPVPEPTPAAVVPEPSEPPVPTMAEPPVSAVAESPVKSNSAVGFYVQVGVYSKSENAKSIRVKLTRAKLPAIAEQIKTAAGPRTRVRVGPFVDRAEAEAALEKVKRAGEKNAVVIKTDGSR